MLVVSQMMGNISILQFKGVLLLNFFSNLQFIQVSFFLCLEIKTKGIGSDSPAQLLFVVICNI